MLNEVIKVAECRNFFKLVHLKKGLNYNLKQCGVCMKNNIVNEWLRYVYLKSSDRFKVVVRNENDKPVLYSTELKKTSPQGLVEISRKKSKDTSDENNRYFEPNKFTELKLSVAVDQTEAMQFFLQWQRYRKIWWSSITTTPGLFHLRDITYKEKSAEVEIMANFPWGPQSVENISIAGSTPLNKTSNRGPKKWSNFQCSLSVERALLTLLTDGYSNRTSEGYLRLHRTMAPYKVSFALDCKDAEKKSDLVELAQLINYELNQSGISTWLPDDFDQEIGQQYAARYLQGVPYTVVLTADCLRTGILQLLNSSTTLMEQIHISDLNDYAKKLFKSCFVSN